MEPNGRQIRWRRRFGRRQLVTTQRFTADSLLAERMGCLELRFRLVTRGACLAFVPLDGAVWLGRWRVPLPRWAAPVVAGVVRCSPRLDRLEVRIRMRAPWIGELLRYEGAMDVSTEGWS